MKEIQELWQAFDKYHWFFWFILLVWLFLATM